VGEDATAIIEQFLERQRAMYAGGELEPVAALLAEDILWHVPGASPIGGDYRGREAVLGYFAQRRELAGGEISIVKHGELGAGDVLVQLADGHATLGGEPLSWRTAGIYRVADGRIVEAWLVPLESGAFEQAWCRTRAAPFVYRQRVRPQDCAASTFLGHPRFLEFFEAAFVEWWRARVGSSLQDTLEPGRRLTLASVEVDYLAPVEVDDELRVEVHLDRRSARSLQIHYDAHVGEVLAARGSSRYVCLDARSGRPAAFPRAVLESVGETGDRRIAARGSVS
jgi:uncharacterized protein